MVPKEKAAKINRNPDWICDYCRQLNSDYESSLYDFEDSNLEVGQNLQVEISFGHGKIIE